MNTYQTFKAEMKPPCPFPLHWRVAAYTTARSGAHAVSTNSPLTKNPAFSLNSERRAVPLHGKGKGSHYSITERRVPELTRFLEVSLQAA